MSHPVAAPGQNWHLADLLEIDPARCAGNPEILGLSSDSRLVEPGGLFLACRGNESHGLNHLEQAIARGAVAVAWEPSGLFGPVECGLPCVAVPNLSRRVGLIAARFHRRPSSKLFVLGVTGTDGKTSCSHLFAQTAAALNRRCGLIGTVGFGFLDDLHSATHTTPDPVALQAWLARLVDAGAEALAMEVSSHALDQGRINGVELDAAIFTNLSRDHLDYHGDLRNYARAKRRLLDAPGLSALIINIDDDHGLRWAREFAAEGRPVVPYSLERTVEFGEALQAVDLQQDPEGLRFCVRAGREQHAFACGLIGRFNVYNLLAVAAAWRAAGVPLAQVLKAMSSVGTVPGRIEAFRAEGRPLVVVDYAHTPGALKQVLLAVTEHRGDQGRLICVFGCGGDRDRGKRPQMTAAAASLADLLILTDDNPRSESPQDIVADMLDGMPAGQAYRVIHDRARAIAEAIDEAGPDDVVVIAGKGHEDYQQVGQEKRPFSDRAQVSSRLEGRACNA